jgi:hypothetical protein
LTETRGSLYFYSGGGGVLIFGNRRQQQLGNQRYFVVGDTDMTTGGARMNRRIVAAIALAGVVLGLFLTPNGPGRGPADRSAHAVLSAAGADPAGDLYLSDADDDLDDEALVAGVDHAVDGTAGPAAIREPAPGAVVVPYRSEVHRE